VVALLALTKQEVQTVQIQYLVHLLLLAVEAGTGITRLVLLVVQAVAVLMQVLAVRVQQVKGLLEEMELIGQVVVVVGQVQLVLRLYIEQVVAQVGLVLIGSHLEHFMLAVVVVACIRTEVVQQALAALEVEQMVQKVLALHLTQQQILVVVVEAAAVNQVAQVVLEL
jgi:hypothetical protein